MSWKMPKDMSDDFDKKFSHTLSREDTKDYLRPEVAIKLWVGHWFEKLVSKEVQKIIHNNKLV